MYNDWVDLPGDVTEGEVAETLAIEYPDVDAYYIREDLFCNYPDGHTIRRIYLHRKRSCQK